MACIIGTVMGEMRLLLEFVVVVVGDECSYTAQLDDQSNNNIDISGHGTVIHNMYRNHSAIESPGKNKLVKIRRRINDEVDMVHNDDDVVVGGTFCCCCCCCCCNTMGGPTNNAVVASYAAFGIGNTPALSWFALF
jgi:hypothetical protein